MEFHSINRSYAQKLITKTYNYNLYFSLWTPRMRWSACRKAHMICASQNSVLIILKRGMFWSCVLKFHYCPTNLSVTTLLSCSLWPSFHGNNIQPHTFHSGESSLRPSNTKIVCSNPVRGMGVCPRCFWSYVELCR